METITKENLQERFISAIGKCMILFIAEINFTLADGEQPETKCRYLLGCDVTNCEVVVGQREPTGMLIYTSVEKYSLDDIVKLDGLTLLEWTILMELEFEKYLKEIE